jgi:hypothetical protein
MLPVRFRVLASAMLIGCCGLAARGADDGLVVGAAPASQAVADDALWVDWTAPDPQATVSSPVALAEIRGRAGQGPRALDLAVVLDVSASAFYPSGADVDGDGVTAALHGRGPLRLGGGLRPVADWTTDPDDSVVRAEIAAVGRLLDQLDADATRVGLVTFAGRPRTRVDLGLLADARTELASFRPRLSRDGTDLGAAIRAGLRMLGMPRDGQRQRILVLLSDGDATAPAPAIYARRRALAAAERARELGVPIFAFSLGGDPDGEVLLAELAALTGGRFCALERVADLLENLPYTRFSAVESVAIENRTSGQAGRAIRIFADGSFDGFVPLVPGPNAIAIHVRAGSGERARMERQVTFEPLAANSPEFLAEVAALHRQLELRALETELAERVRSRTRRVEIKPAP